MKCSICNSEYKNGRCYPCMIKKSWEKRNRVQTVRSKCIVCNSDMQKILIKNNQIETCSLSCARKFGWQNGSRKNAEITTIKCLVCNKEKSFRSCFYKLHPAKFCSRKCMGIAKDKKIEISCDYCKNIFKRRKDKIKEVNYCSKQCSDVGRLDPNAFWRDKEKISQYHRIYKHHFRASKKLGFNGKITFSLKDWKDLLLKYGAKCMSCSSYENITIDHIKSIHNGGENHKNNIQILCKKCNSSKGTSEKDYRPFVQVENLK